MKIHDGQNVTEIYVLTCTVGLCALLVRDILWDMALVFIRQALLLWKQ